MPSPLPGPSRSATPFTLGLWSMILGAICVASSVVRFARDGAPPLMEKAAVGHPELVERYLADTRASQTLMISLFCACSLALVYIGLGQRRYMRWAPRASITWSIAALVQLALSVVVQVAIVSPARARFADAVGPAFQSSPLTPWLTVIGTILLASYPLVLIRAFRQPHNVSAMDQPPPPPLPAATLV